ncbi:hypothetical protein [Desertibaculum subflavum]|uniref:hypothetical protein n=1 Tax=Desertibaculum subflavum TaxID=2268458 RepID=UPI0013C4B9DD
MASLPLPSQALRPRGSDLPCLEYLLRRFDRAGVPRPNITWDPAIDSLPSAALRAVQARWSAGGRPDSAPPVPPSGELVFIDPSFRLVGYPRRDGGQIVAVGDGADGAGALDIADLPIEVDLLRAVYAVAAAYGHCALISLERPTTLERAIVDRVVLPTGRRGLLVARAPRL